MMLVTDHDITSIPRDLMKPKLLQAEVSPMEILEVESSERWMPSQRVCSSAMANLRDVFRTEPLASSEEGEALQYPHVNFLCFCIKLTSF